MLEELLDMISTRRCRVCKRAVVEDIGQRYLCNVCYEAALHSIYSSAKTDTELEIYYATDYAGWARSMMRDYKYRQRHLARFWAKLLGDYILREWKPLLSSMNIYLSSIPLHAARLRQRGYDQAALIAKALERRLRHAGINVDYLPGLIERTKDTPSLYKLNTSEREAALSDAFSLGSSYHHCPEFACGLLLIVDDIVTTGATFSSAITSLDSQLGFRAILPIACAGRNLD